MSLAKAHPHLHGIWGQMIQRCTNPAVRGFRGYGGRGITVCERWRSSFAYFLEDMGPRPIGTSLDRIDPDGNYEPANCRWADKLTQANNTRTNRYVTFRGERMTIAELARRSGISYRLLHKRLQHGWPLEDAIAAPKRGRNRLTLNGVTLTIVEWTKRLGFSQETIRHRMRRGLPVEQILSPKKWEGGRGRHRR